MRYYNNCNWFLVNALLHTERNQAIVDIELRLNPALPPGELI